MRDVITGLPTFALCLTISASLIPAKSFVPVAVTGSPINNAVHSRTGFLSMRRAGQGAADAVDKSADVAPSLVERVSVVTPSGFGNVLLEELHDPPRPERLARARCH